MFRNVPLKLRNFPQNPRNTPLALRNTPRSHRSVPLDPQSTPSDGRRTVSERGTAWYNLRRGEREMGPGDCGHSIGAQERCTPSSCPRTSWCPRRGSSGARMTTTPPYRRSPPPRRATVAERQRRTCRWPRATPWVATGPPAPSAPGRGGRIPWNTTIRATGFVASPIKMLYAVCRSQLLISGGSPWLI